MREGSFSTLRLNSVRKASTARESVGSTPSRAIARRSVLAGPKRRGSRASVRKRSRQRARRSRAARRATAPPFPSVPSHSRKASRLAGTTLQVLVGGAAAGRVVAEEVLLDVVGRPAVTRLPAARPEAKGLVHHLPGVADLLLARAARPAGLEERLEHGLVLQPPQAVERLLLSPGPGQVVGRGGHADLDVAGGHRDAEPLLDPLGRRLRNRRRCFSTNTRTASRLAVAKR